jgi:hypothetical protein
LEPIPSPVALAAPKDHASYSLWSEKLHEFRRLGDDLAKQAFGGVGQMFRMSLDSMTGFFQIGKEVRSHRKRSNPSDIDPERAPLTVFARSVSSDLDFTPCPRAITPGKFVQTKSPRSMEGAPAITSEPQ